MEVVSFRSRDVDIAGHLYLRDDFDNRKTHSTIVCVHPGSSVKEQTSAPEARGGAYYGPTGMMEARGPLGLAEVPPAAMDAEAAARLWTISEKLSGTRFPTRLAD